MELKVRKNLQKFLTGIYNPLLSILMCTLLCLTFYVFWIERQENSANIEFYSTLIIILLFTPPFPYLITWENYPKLSQSGANYHRSTNFIIAPLILSSLHSFYHHSTYFIIATFILIPHHFFYLKIHCLIEIWAK